MVSQVSICPQGGGVHPLPGRHPLGRDPPGQTPPVRQKPPPPRQADTLCQQTPPAWQTPPWADTPLSSRHPPAGQTPPCQADTLPCQADIPPSSPLEMATAAHGMHPQGSHSDWKTWKNEKAFTSQGILNRLEKSGKSQGKPHKMLENSGNLKYILFDTFNDI